MYGLKFSVMVYWCIFRFLKMFSLYISKCFRVFYFCSNDDNNNCIIKNVEFINKQKSIFKSVTTKTKKNIKIKNVKHDYLSQNVSRVVVF